jgi:hypothetical protein
VGSVEGTTRAAEGLEEGDLEGLAEEVRAAAARTSEKIGSRFEVQGSRSQVSVFSYEI